MKCPSCGERISSEPIDSHEGYQLYHCHACDLMFWHPMKSPGPEWYEATYPVSTELTLFSIPRTNWQHEQFLKDMPASGGALLEIGCGVGDFLFHAQRAGYSVTGIDFSSKFIEIARRRFGFESLYALTLEDLVAKKPQDKYDVITFWGTLEHLDNITDFLHSVRALLKSGGYIACEVPNRERWRFGLLWEGWDYPPNHLTRWNHQALVNLFTRNGFSILMIKTQPLHIKFFGYGGWLVTQKLGIGQLLVKLAGKLVGRGRVKQAGAPQNSTLSTTRGVVIKRGGQLYHKILVPLLGALTSPLWLLLRRQGEPIYLLATVGERK